jgi:hypothetical protein
MYDPNSESLWQQITGRSIGGPRRGEVLQPVPLTMSVWSDWRPLNPGAEVLAPPRGRAAYARRHYADYEQSDGLMFPVTASDARLAPKRVIYGVELSGRAVAIDAAWLDKVQRWSRSTDAGDLTLTLSDDGGVNGLLDGQPIAVHRMFWFAWYSFHPTTALVDGSEAEQSE